MAPQATQLKPSGSQPAASSSSSSTAGKNTTTTTSAATTSQSTFDEASFVFHINLFILSIVALYFLLQLPRFLARLYRFSEWSNGHFLRRVRYPRRPTRRLQSIFIDDSGDTVSDYSSYKFSRRPTGQPINYPPHVASSPRFLRPEIAFLRKRISPGFSIGQFLVLTVWFSILLYPTFYKSQGPLLDPVRAGWIGIAQLPFAFAFSMKNNVLGWLLGTSYEKINFLHRFVGRLVVLAINIHAIDYFYKWLLNATFQKEILVPAHLWGLVGLAAVDALFFFSTAWWRLKVYNIFLATHVVGTILLFPAIWFHFAAMRPYFFACIALYAVDQVLRQLKTRITTAVIKPMPQHQGTRVECHSLTVGWRAGQHVRIRVLSGGMGWFKWSESHPFTVASLSGSGEGLILMVKKSGGWSDKLFELAQEKKGFSGGRTVKVMVEGPYGGPGHTMFASFSAAVFVTGGSGISFGLSAIQDLIDKDLRGECRVKVMRLVWMVQDPAALVPMLPQFTSLVAQSIYTQIKIDIFYTRAPVGKFPFPEDFAPRNIYLCPGRPALTKMFEDVIAQTCRVGSHSNSPKNSGLPSGLVVGVCGPIELADDVSNLVGQIDPARRDQVGGVELFEEVFGL